MFKSKAKRNAGRPKKENWDASDDEADREREKARIRMANTRSQVCFISYYFHSWAIFL